MKTSLQALEAAHEVINQLINRIHGQQYDWNADPDQMTLKTGRTLELLGHAIHQEKCSTVITLSGGGSEALELARKLASEATSDNLVMPYETAGFV